MNPNKLPKLILSIIISISLSFGIFMPILMPLSVQLTPRTLTINLSEHAKENSSFNIYYDIGYGYNGENRIEVSLNPKERKITFPLPRNKIQNIRIDPPETKGSDLKIESIEFGPLKWDAKQIKKIFIPNDNIKTFKEENNILYLSSQGIDPFFYSTGNLDTAYQPSKIHQIFIFIFVTLIAISLIFFIRIISFNFFKILLGFSFVLILWTPSLGMYLDLFPKPQNTENRQLTEKPIFKITSATKFPSLYATYFNDNFGLRNYLIRLNTIIKINLFNISPIDAIIVGKNGWLFPREGIKSYQGIELYSEKELQEIKDNVTKQAKWLQERNIFFLIVICPDKYSIYSEYLPLSIKKIHQKTKIDQVITLFKKYPNIHILDLREVLIKNKSLYPLYYKTDTHWNNYGVAIAYEEISKILHKNFPQISPMTLSDIEIKKTKEEGKDLAQLLTIQDKMKDKYFTMEVKKSFFSKKLPSLIFFHDSFGYLRMTPQIPNSLYQLLQFHFKKIITQRWNTGFDYKLVDKERPTVVIYEVVERFASSTLKDNLKDHPIAL